MPPFGYYENFFMHHFPFFAYIPHYHHGNNFLFNEGKQKYRPQQIAYMDSCVVTTQVVSDNPIIRDVPGN